jgi:hypothetical protein
MCLIFPYCQVTDKYLLAKLFQTLSDGTIPDVRLVGMHIDESVVLCYTLKCIVVAIRVLPQSKQNYFLNPIPMIQH